MTLEKTRGKNVNPYSSISINFQALARGVSKYPATELDAQGLASVINIIASLGATSSVSPAFIASALSLICANESSYPSKPRYYSVQPDDRGSARYVGVAQISRGYWSDASSYLVRKGLNTLTDVDPRQVTIYQQLVHVLAYVVRYRGVITAPYSVEGVYAVHNQGFSIDLRNRRYASGDQSGPAQRTFALARKQSLS